MSNELLVYVYDRKTMASFASERAIVGGDKEGTKVDTPSNYTEPNPMRDQTSKIHT